MGAAKPALGYASRTQAAQALEREGLSTQAIAGRLGISQNAVSGLLAGAKAYARSRETGPVPGRPYASPSESNLTERRPTTTAEVRELLLRIPAQQFARLVEAARKAGHTPAVYAGQLLQAAWSARCAPTGDAALDTAVGRLGEPDTTDWQAEARSLQGQLQAASGRAEHAQAALAQAERQLAIVAASLADQEAGHAAERKLIEQERTAHAAPPAPDEPAITAGQAQRIRSYARSGLGTDDIAASMRLPREAVDGDRITVIDGDTVALPCAVPGRGCAERVRVYSIDAPETRGARCPAEREAGLRAKARLAALLRRQAVSIERCEPGINGRAPRCTDRYGRTLARLVTAAGDVGSVLIAEGLATRWPVRADWCGGGE
jgi:endonuclease YncB( thermonuclease family)